MSDTHEPPANDTSDQPTPAPPEDLTPAQSFTEASRRGVHPLVWTFFFLCEYVFSIALLSLVSTIMFGWSGETARTWAWYGGAALAGIGIPLGLVRIRLGQWVNESQPLDDEEGTPMGVLGSIVAVGLIGLLIGVIVGGGLAVVVASVAVSPFGPESWRDGPADSFPWRVPFLVFGWTVGFLVAGGVLLGFVLGLRGEVKRLR